MIRWTGLAQWETGTFRVGAEKALDHVLARPRLVQHRDVQREIPLVLAVDRLRVGGP